MIKSTMQLFQLLMATIPSELIHNTTPGSCLKQTFQTEIDGLYILLVAGKLKQAFLYHSSILPFSCGYIC